MESLRVYRGEFYCYSNNWESFGRVESNFYRIVDLLIAVGMLLIVIFINYLFYKVMRRIGEMSKRWMLIPLVTAILTVVISFITF